MAQTWHMVLTQTRTSAYKCVFVNRPAVGLELATCATFGSVVDALTYWATRPISLQPRVLNDGGVIMKIMKILSSVGVQKCFQAG